MSTDLILESDEAQSLVRQLCMLTGETTSAAVTQALRAHVRRTQELRALRPVTDRSDVLARAIRANAGAGIPVNHCWDQGAARPPG